MSHANPNGAQRTVWAIVNAVNILQSLGFLSRIFTGEMQINHLLGVLIAALAVPAVFALVNLLQQKAGWREWIGLCVFLAFVVLMLGVDYFMPVEFRSPARPAILAPYLVLFFGSIFLMGLPMFHTNRRLWLVTVLTTLILLGSMGAAMRMGVG